jgi:hypothetical protein
MIEETIEVDELNDWRPSDVDIKSYFKESGWPTFDKIRYDHIDNEKERTILETAVRTCQEYIDDIKNTEREKIPSMIMLSSSVDGDMDRTGYGCGKTTLAKIVHHAIGYCYITPETKLFEVYPFGKFYESRMLMALFDEDRSRADHILHNIDRLLVVDDVGREGTLKWERRDPELQLEEKQDRYYTIINKCYERGTGILITSNMTSRELAAYLGGASWSRLLQMAPKKYRINMTGVRDMRPMLSESEWF